MLKVTNLLKNFQNEERNVLNNVTFEASRGELIAIIGKSGSGKTTLMNIIAGLEKPSAGFVFFDGEELTTYKEDEYSIFRNENIGIVFQEFNLIEELNVIDNVILPLTLISPNNKENKKQGMQLLKKFRIDNICKRLAKNLSGGEKAKVGISRAMINNPDMVLCDEPTGSLDSENAVIVFQTLKQISKDKLVIVVTHDDALIEEYATRLIRIHDGKIISDETRQPNIRKESTKTYRRNLKKENPAATSKLILSHLANRKNKFSLTITSLSFSFLFMLLTFMFLFGFRYNINRSLNEISNPNEYIGIKYNYTEINEADRQYITQNFDVKEVFLKEVYRNTLSNESATFDTTIENIPEDQDDFNFKKRLIGSHPNTQN
jgi:putative ABC transport system permease protein